MSDQLKSKNMLFLSQVRLSSVDNIPGKAFHEAFNWSFHFNQVIFLCFSDNKKFHYKKLRKNFTVIAIPFNLSDSFTQTITDLAKNYARLLYYLLKIIKRYKIDLIREENLIIAGLPTLIASKITRVPYTTWLGGFERKSFALKYKPNILSFFVKVMIIFLEYLVFNTSSLVFTVSKELYDLIGRRKADNRILSPNFVDFSLFTEKNRSLHETNKKISILYSGRFEREKGIDVLLKAIKLLSTTNDNFDVKLVGYGSLEPWIRNYLKTNNLENIVKLPGKFPLSKLPVFYRNADIFVMPSYTEGLPAALLEAMCSGCACVCTDVGMMPNYIENEKNGLIVPSNDHVAFAGALKFLIENPEKITLFGKNSRKIIEENSKGYIEIHKKKYQYIIDNFRRK